MTEREFCYWLQGWLEIGGCDTLNQTQVAVIKDHLKLVFTKVTPLRGLGIPNVPATPIYRHPDSVIC